MTKQKRKKFKKKMWAVFHSDGDWYISKWKTAPTKTWKNIRVEVKEL